MPVVVAIDIWSTYSPITRTNASTPAQSNLRAVTGVRVKTSRLFGEGGEASSSLADKGIRRPASAEGFGRGGIVNESAESCTSVSTTYVGDMMSREGEEGSTPDGVQRYIKGRRLGV